MSESAKSTQSGKSYDFEYVPGIFDASNWSAALNGKLGLTLACWDRNNSNTTDEEIAALGSDLDFLQTIDSLKESCTIGQSIKVFYPHRHGQGEHNVLGEITYKGNYVKASKEGNPDVDPFLTVDGRSQASSLHEAIKRNHEKGMPLPESCFSGPLSRQVETALIAWNGYIPESKASDSSTGELGLNIKNGLRERLHTHNWNKRSTKTGLGTRYPQVSLSSNMPEEDTYFEKFESLGRHQTEEEMQEQVRSVLSEIISERPNDTFLVLGADISLTSSAGALTEMFKVLGVPSLVKDENDPRKVQKEWNEGQMRPVVIKVTEVSAA